MRGSCIRLPRHEPSDPRALVSRSSINLGMRTLEIEKVDNYVRLKKDVNTSPAHESVEMLLLFAQQLGSLTLMGGRSCTKVSVTSQNGNETD